MTTSGIDPSAAVLAWGERHRRDLPWRNLRDPWAVLVSELMLQQTQVSRVVPKWTSFMDRFPTVRSCAESPVGDVITLWHGLGYNRRAVHLHQAAVIVVDHHSGQIPRGIDELMSLPGIGPYTARAVLAFAFEADVGVLDTNAARVLARAIAGRRLARAEAQRLADALVPAGTGWAFNQAMLDLGATLCTASDPGCGRCPIQGVCRWSAADRPEPDPARGSAGVSSGQSRFEGSDRQGRGRLVAALRAGAVLNEPVALALACGWPGQGDRAARVGAGLVADGLAVVDGARLRLPG